MKRRLLTFLLAVVVIVGFIPNCSVDAAGKRTKKAAYKAYYSWINSSKSKISEYNKNKYNKYQLVDLDNDKIPELIGLYEDRNSTLINYYVVCSYDGEKVNTIGLMSGVAGAGGFRGGVSYIPKTGKVMQGSISSGTGSTYNSYYQVKKGKINQTHSVSAEYDFITSKFTYRCDGKKVSKSKYKTSVKKFFNSKKSKDFDDIKFISKKKMLKKLK